MPIACSLDATELPQRLAAIADLGRAALVDARVASTRAELRFAAGPGVRERVDAIVDARIASTRDELRFAADPGVRERVDAIVAAESRCCPFLAMRVGEAPGAVVLAIEAPAGAEVVLEELVDAFRGRPRASQR